MNLAYFPYILLIICVLYFILMLILGYAWSRIRWEHKPMQPRDAVSVSLIVAIRNEKDSLDALFHSLKSESYPQEALQVILVNDHSDDGSKEMLEAFKDQCPYELLLIHLEESKGKKSAIRAGIAQSNGDLLLFTDADCKFQNGWVERHALAYAEGSKFSSGPVMFERARNFWQNLMQLEFIGLVASGGSGIFLNLNLLANGANMSLPKKTFLEIEDKIGGLNTASGDDVYLLSAIAKNFPKQTRFIKDPIAIVETKYEKSIGAFVQQRLRWASKGGSYLNPPSVIIALLIYLTNALLVFAPFVMRDWWVLVVVLGIKLLADRFFYSTVLGFFKQRRLIAFVLIAQVFHIPYVVFTGLFGSLVPYKWKGRKSN
jgi:glycosyltransferase involved in cell wall biosynthesis